MAKRRVVKKRFNAFAGESSDTPPSGNVASFESFQNLIPTAISDSKTTEATTPTGYTMQNYVPLQQNISGGATGSAADTFDLVMLKFPGVAGNVMCAVHNGDGDSGSASVGVGRQGEIIGLYQELWEQPEISVLSRNIETPAEPVEVLGDIFVGGGSGSGGDSPVYALDTDSFTFTDTGETIPYEGAMCVGAVPLCTDLEGNLWVFADTDSGDSGGFKFYKISQEGDVTEVGEVLVDAQPGTKIYGTADRSGSGVFFIMTGHTWGDYEGIPLYHADTEVALVGTINVDRPNAWTQPPRGLDVDPDGNLIMVGVEYTEEDGFFVSLMAATTEGVAVDGYPKRIDTTQTDSYVVWHVSACMAASTTHLYFCTADSIRRVAWADINTAGSSTAIGGNLSDHFGYTAASGGLPRFSVDPTSGDLIVTYFGSESGLAMAVWDASEAEWVDITGTGLNIVYASFPDYWTFQDDSYFYVAGTNSVEGVDVPCMIRVSKSDFGVEVVNQTAVEGGLQSPAQWDANPHMDPNGWWLANHGNGVS